MVATGFKPIDLDKFDEFAYAQTPDVVTSLEFERLMNAAGPTERHSCCGPPTDEHPHTHRVYPVRGLPRTPPGCGQALLLQNLLHVHRQARHAGAARNIRTPNVYVFYIDVRTPGKNFDEFYRRAVEQYGVDYIKGMVGKVVPGRTAS